MNILKDDGKTDRWIDIFSIFMLNLNRWVDIDSYWWKDGNLYSGKWTREKQAADAHEHTYGKFLFRLWKFWILNGDTPSSINFESLKLLTTKTMNIYWNLKKFLDEIRNKKHYKFLNYCNLLIFFCLILMFPVFENQHNGLRFFN